MGKTLIRCNCIEQHICQENNTIYMNNAMILTSEAKDYLRNKGIAIVYGEKPAAPAVPATAPAPNQEEMELIMEKVITILRDEHQITDTKTLKALGLKILTRLNSN
ncbi:MAG: hypothetical protein JEZ12_18300 [Desulfobacterium sp.]|nr:hypothetical protein [Desulfobacterium sp.]